MNIDQFPLALVQSAWVVADLEQAMKAWIELGVGPFFKFDVNVPNALYRGKVSPLAFTVALAQAGPMQIEYIYQRSDGPSAYRDSVPQGSSGFHHVCQAFGGYDETMEKLQKQGVQIATEFEIGGARACYADTRSTLGCMLELVDDSAVAQRLRSTVTDAAINWDGRDPIRPLALL